MLVWRKGNIVYYCNGAQKYEQFLQVGRLYLAWFSSLSSEQLCVFGLHGAIYYNFFAYIHLFTF